MGTRRSSVVLGLGAALVAAAAALAPPASAGGPTSVLLVAPGTGRATALTWQDPRYAALESLVSGTTSAPGPAAPLGVPEVTITWMVHDVMPWRIDHLAVTDGQVRVATATDTSGSGEEFGETATARIVAQPEKLLALLTDLGVLGPDPSGTAGAVAPQAIPAEGPAATPAASPDAPADPATASGTDEALLPALAGGVAGLALGASAVLLPVVRRRRRDALRGTDPVPAAPVPAADAGADAVLDTSLDAPSDAPRDAPAEVVTGYPGRV